MGTLELALRVVEALDRDTPVPCTGPSAALWTHPQTPGEVAEAMLGCRGCALLQVCATVSEEVRPWGVVQGGRYWAASGPSECPPRRLASAW